MCRFARVRLAMGFVFGALALAGSASADTAGIPFLVRLSGKVVVKGAEGQNVGVELGRTVAPGTSIEVTDGGHARLTYPNGSRFDLLDGTRLVLGPTPPKPSEKVVPLEGKSSPLQLLPLLNPPAGSFAAVRVRGKKIAGFQIVTSAESVALAFEPVAGAAYYRIQIAAKGAVVFESVTSEPRIVVPATALAQAGNLAAEELRCVVVTHDAAGDLIEGAIAFPWQADSAGR